MKKKQILLALFTIIMLFNSLEIFAQSSKSDSLFNVFFKSFQIAVNSNNKLNLSNMSEFSIDKGGYFSSPNKAIFMENVYKSLFSDYWKFAIKNAQINKTIKNNYGGIITLQLIEPTSWGYNSKDILYSLDNGGNAILFKQINGVFKLVGMFSTEGGD